MLLKNSFRSFHNVRCSNITHIDGNFLCLRKSPRYSSLEDIKKFLSANNCPLPNKFYKTISGGKSKRVDWLLEYENIGDNELAFKELNKKRFGQYIMHPSMEKRAKIVDLVDENPYSSLCLENLPPNANEEYIVNLIESKAPGLNIRSISIFYYDENSEIVNAYVCFETEEEASLSSIILNGTLVDGYKINAIPLA